MQYGARPLRSTRRLANLAGTRPGWYTIVNSAAPGAPSMVTIYDEIGFFGVSAADFMSELRGIQGDIELHLNSPGGDVFDGIAIYNTLRQARGAKRVIVDGLAASAASFIAMAASPGMLEMAPHSQLMIHDGFAMGIGNAADLRSLAVQLDQVSDEIAGIYADRTGKPAAHWRELMQAETWFTDKQAVAAGLADKVHGQESAPENVWDLSVFARYAEISAPPALPVPPSSQARNADTSGDEPLGDGWFRRDGKTVFDPEQDGDDDSSAETDTDHDYWSEDGKQLKPVPPRPGATANQARPGAFPVLDADVDRSEWDAGKAWKAGAASDDPEAFYRGICAGRKAGDPSTQAAWALPYKYSPKSPPNAAGVRDALSRLPQTHGLANAAEARATLERAMKEVNPEYEPDDCIDPELLAAVLTHGLEGANRK